MTDDRRSLERAARSWLEAGPTEAPDHAVEAALLRIQTTSQEWDWHVPRRNRSMTIMARLVAAAIALAVVAVGGIFILRPGTQTVGSTSSPSLAATPSAAAAASLAPSAPSDWSSIPGRLLVEHYGNPLDLSDPNGAHDNTFDLWLMDPADMSSRTAVEFLKGAAAPSKQSVDVSSDSRKVVFEDHQDENRLYEANVDGTGFHQLSIPCSVHCAFLEPDYDPAGTRIVYVRIEPGQAWLEILDLATGKVTKLTTTVGPDADAIPSQPAWSPDGRTIAFARITWAGATGGQAPKSGRLSLLDVATSRVTDLPVDPALVPGDPNWSPDSRTIVFAAGPMSQTGGVSQEMVHANYAIRADGTNLRQIPGLSSPEYLPGGQYILYKTGCRGQTSALCDGLDTFGVMRSDFTDGREINSRGMDFTDGPQGFSFVAHWLAP
jgi:hypothetical protein